MNILMNVFGRKLFTKNMCFFFITGVSDFWGKYILKKYLIPLSKLKNTQNRKKYSKKDFSQLGTKLHVDTFDEVLVRPKKLNFSSKTPNFYA